MRNLTLTSLMALGLAMFASQPALAQSDDVNISGMDCTAAANHLNDVIEQNDFMGAEEERRMEFMVTGARQDCLENGSREALQRVSRLMDDTRWINEQDWMAGVE